MYPNEIEKLHELIRICKNCMLTTTDAQGRLRSRPMATQDDFSDEYLWFFTSLSGAKAEEIQLHDAVNLAYSVPEKNHFVSVTGHALVLSDRKKMRELWRPAYRAWFPKGVESKDLALLRVEVEVAEYWESPGGPAAQIFGLAKSLVTGERYGPKGHGRIEIGEKHPE